MLESGGSSPGLEHFAFTFANIADLVRGWQQRKESHIVDARTRYQVLESQQIKRWRHKFQAISGLSDPSSLPGTTEVAFKFQGPIGGVRLAGYLPSKDGPTIWRSSPGCTKPCRDLRFTLRFD